MNAKIGLPLWTVPRPAFLGKKTMIIGINNYYKLISKGNLC